MLYSFVMLKVGALSFSVRTIFLKNNRNHFLHNLPTVWKLLNEMNLLPLVMSSVLVVKDNFAN